VEKLFDTKRDITSEKWEEIRSLYLHTLRPPQEQQKVNQDEPNTGYLNYAAGLSLLGEHVNLSEFDKAAIRYVIKSVRERHSPVTLLGYYVGQAKLLGIDDTLSPDEKEKLQSEFQRILEKARTSKEFSQLVQIAADLKILGFELNLLEGDISEIQDWINTQFPLEKDMQKLRAGVRSFVSNVAYSRIIGINPKISAEQSKLIQEWFRNDVMRKDGMHVVREGAHLVVVSADEVMVPAGGGLVLKNE